jgi:hypothetical protein
MLMRRVAKPIKTNHIELDSLIRKDERLMPISLLDGPTSEEILLALNLRHDWRGFSFGNFWFGYYFTLPQPSPQVEERFAV